MSINDCARHHSLKGFPREEIGGLGQEQNIQVIYTRTKESSQLYFYILIWLVLMMSYETIYLNIEKLEIT